MWSRYVNSTTQLPAPRTISFIDYLKLRQNERGKEQVKHCRAWNKVVVKCMQVAATITI